MSSLSALAMLALLLVVIGVLSAPLTAVRRRKAGRSAVLADLEARRESKYREIRDAELDHAMGKHSPHDYELVDAALRAEAVEILNRIEALKRDQEADSGQFLQEDDRVQHEEDGEEDRPAVEVALDHRAAAERPGAAADSEGA